MASSTHPSFPSRQYGSTTFGASTAQQKREHERVERERERLERERVEREKQDLLTEEQREEIKEAVSNNLFANDTILQSPLAQ